MFYPFSPADGGKTVRQSDQDDSSVLTACQELLPSLVGGQTVDWARVDFQ